MIYFFIALGAWLCSLLGILAILRKKLPQIKEIPVGRTDMNWKSLAQEWLYSFRRSAVAQNNHPEKLLHRMLSKTRVIMLRSERQVSTWLERLRKNTQEKNQTKTQHEHKSFSEDYWGKLKKKKSTGEKGKEED